MDEGLDVFCHLLRSTNHNEPFNDHDGVVSSEFAKYMYNDGCSIYSPRYRNRIS